MIKGAIPTGESSLFPLAQDVFSWQNGSGGVGDTAEDNND
jgi:hypothetical protein